MTLILIVSFALLGGWFSRMCGGGPPKLPWGLDQWIYAFPYMLIALLPSATILYLLKFVDDEKKPNWKYVALVAVGPYLGALVGKRTGHGGGLDMGRSEKEPFAGRDPEKLEYLILWLHDKMPRYWYDALIMAITGLAVTLVPGIVVAFLDLWAGVFLALSGLSKAPAYMIGYLIYPNGQGRGIPHLNEGSAIGEFLTGFFGYGALGITFIWITG